MTVKNCSVVNFGTALFVLCVSGAGVKFGSLGGELGVPMKLNHEKGGSCTVPHTKGSGKVFGCICSKTSEFSGNSSTF